VWKLLIRRHEISKQTNISGDDPRLAAMGKETMFMGIILSRFRVTSSFRALGTLLNRAILSMVAFNLKLSREILLEID
jgi:hypothetical protein